MIRLENVTKTYRTSTRPALDKVSVDIGKGEFVFLIGPSGSGKSTLLRLLLREDVPTKGDVYVRGASQREMMTFLNTFRKVGGAFEVDDQGIRFWHPGGPLNAIALETDVHPGFQTDWQQPLVVALTQASGLSIVHETVYESRLGFTSALNQMGAHIQLYRECLGGTPCRFGRRNFLHSAVVSGPTKLEGADLVIPDLRGGFSYLIAALAAEGTSRVHGIDLINRGYENFMDKLRSLGANVELPVSVGA